LLDTNTYRTKGQLPCHYRRQAKSLKCLDLLRWLARFQPSQRAVLGLYRPKGGKFRALLSLKNNVPDELRRDYEAITRFLLIDAELQQAMFLAVAEVLR